MYACLHLLSEPGEAACGPGLLALAREFSPEVEQTSVGTVVFSITPLRSILGSSQQIVSEICRRGFERKLHARLAIAANPDTAILLARHFSGVTIAEPGEEPLKLAAIPLSSLFAHDIPVDGALLAILHQWGLSSCEDLAALPEAGIVERLGMAGLYLRKLALGRLHRPLRVGREETRYEERGDLDYPLDQLEPLLFLFGRALSDLCGRLRAQSQAARSVAVRLALDGKTDYQCGLEFPVPLDESRAILKLLQLHLERHAPGAAVTSFRLQIDAVKPHCVQGGLFLPPTPEPDKLQVTLARIAGIVGENKVSTPQLVDSFRPDGFLLTALGDPLRQPEPDDPRRRILRLSMRIFRPPLSARVRVVESVPKQIQADRVKGRVLEWSGPWKTSGEWWSSGAWRREEWDVGLDDGALYRIYYELPERGWYVHGIYD